MENYLIRKYSDKTALKYMYNPRARVQYIDLLNFAVSFINVILSYPCYCLHIAMLKFLDGFVKLKK